VVKPSEFTPLADSAVAAVADGLLPPGVVNLVSGGAGAGRALAGHPGVALVSLTGGEGTGRAVAAAAGGSLRRAVLELGGNDAAVVLPSAEPARVASRLLWGAMRNAGQVCVAIKRLYLHERIAGEVIERMVAEARSIRLGHGLDEATQMGPVNNPPMLERVGSLVEEARAEGGKVVCGGAPPRVQGLESGLFYSPTIVAGLDERSRLVSEEHFGPVLAALTFSDEDEAVRRANSTGHGLGASVWGADVRRARGLASRLRAGTVWVNSHAGIDVAAPFGGMGRSGLGRELGRWGLEPYVQWKTVSEAKGPA
jgi:acyl-CoA reductase-like NAD-dependent aldehyde dehydrogenase